MEKFIPYSKLSKKEKRKRNAMRRGTWGALNPVTRKSENPRAYNRRKARKWIDDPLSVLFCYRRLPYRKKETAVAVSFFMLLCRVISQPCS